jgi:hypothetical protein
VKGITYSWIIRAQITFTGGRWKQTRSLICFREAGRLVLSDAFAGFSILRASRFWIVILLGTPEGDHVDRDVVSVSLRCYTRGDCTKKEAKEEMLQE